MIGLLSNAANANSQFLFCVERKWRVSLNWKNSIFSYPRGIYHKKCRSKSFLSKFVFILSTITYLPCWFRFFSRLYFLPCLLGFFYAHSLICFNNWFLKGSLDFRFFIFDHCFDLMQFVRWCIEIWLIAFWKLTK